LTGGQAGFPLFGSLLPPFAWFGAYKFLTKVENSAGSVLASLSFSFAHFSQQVFFLIESNNDYLAREHLTLGLLWDSAASDGLQCRRHAVPEPPTVTVYCSARKTRNSK
jgi:hypothetical protein